MTPVFCTGIVYIVDTADIERFPESKVGLSLFFLYRVTVTRPIAHSLLYTSG